MEKITGQEISALIGKNKLRFPYPLEAQFNDDYYARSIIAVRVALLLGFILYAAFGVLDMIVAPLTKEKIWIIRYAIVCPMIAIVFISTYLDFFKRVMQPAISFVALAVGFGIIAMIAISIDKESGNYYYAGLILVFIWSYTFVRLRFVYASLVCCSIITGYEIAAIFFQGMLKSTELLKAFINNNFFFISANIMGMIVCYLIEQLFRNDFLQRERLKIAKEVDEIAKQTLEDRNLALANRIDELEKAKSEIKALQGFIPICSYCKKIRNDRDYWDQLEIYLGKHSEAKFSHSICPDCYEKNIKPQLSKHRGIGV